MSRAPDTLEPAYDWRRHATCHGEDPDLFYPVGQGPDALNNSDHAKAICAGCPVKAACLQHAIDTGEEHGIWGGLDETERAAMRGRKGRYMGARQLAPCGTTAAHRRHLRRGEPIDEACREADLMDWRVRQAQRRTNDRKRAAA